LKNIASFWRLSNTAKVNAINTYHSLPFQEKEQYFQNVVTMGIKQKELFHELFTSKVDNQSEDLSANTIRNNKRTHHELNRVSFEGDNHEASNSSRD